MKKSLARNYRNGYPRSTGSLSTKALVPLLKFGKKANQEQKDRMKSIAKRHDVLEEFVALVTKSSIGSDQEEDSEGLRRSTRLKKN